MTLKNLRTTISHEGQKYVDDPIYAMHKPRPEEMSPVRMGLAQMFGSPTPQPIQELVGHERVRLRWMKPDGRGGLKPKNKGQP